jgi:hypothetical protein
MSYAEKSLRKAAILPEAPGRQPQMQQIEAKIAGYYPVAPA